MTSKKIEYNKSPKKCKHCDSALPYEKKHNTFCNLSCSTSYNNRTRDSERYQKSKVSSAVELEYNKSPKKCAHCNKELAFEHRAKTFCNSSCAATYNNKKRGPRSETTKKKIQEGVKKNKESLTGIHRGHCKVSFCKVCGVVIRNKHRATCSTECYKSSIGKHTGHNTPLFTIGNGRYCKVTFCKICGTVIKNKHRITCSKECYKKNHSSMASERLSKVENRKNLGRHRRSYMEQSFESWLISNGSPEFETEKSFKNHDLKKTYFADFYFPSLNLIIELDGTQHRKTVEADSIRDAYIKSYYDITVIRIAHQEYQKGSRIDEVKKLLELK